ncbi:MAG: hypothetical protein ACJZ15_07565 [Candidatus Neomarinimicrobiota bacterium]
MLYEPDPQQRRKYRQDCGIDNKDSATDAERIQVEMWQAGQRDGQSSERLSAG